MKPPQQFSPVMKEEDCVVGLFMETDSLFCDDEPFSSADINLFIVRKPPKARDSKCTKNSNLLQP